MMGNKPCEDPGACPISKVLGSQLSETPCAIPSNVKQKKIAASYTLHNNGRNAKPGKLLWVLEATHSYLEMLLWPRYQDRALQLRLHLQAALLLRPYDQAGSMILKMSEVDKI